MLSELRVTQLGVIEDLTLVFGPGMTALTGETGAGKTLVVEAVELLLGGRADSVLVRPGATEAVVEGRFVLKEGTQGERELVLRRVVPAEGRSRAYVDGAMATAAALSQVGESLVDLHGQHAHQSLLSVSSQREALDAYAGVDRSRRDQARDRLRRLEEAMASAGGSAHARQREVDILRFQLAELEAAKLTSASEDDELADEELSLARASDYRAAAAGAHEAIAGEGQLIDRLGELVARLGGSQPLAGLHERLKAVLVELADAAGEARALAESLEDDPERLAEVTARRGLLHELRRKYGGPLHPTAPRSEAGQGGASAGASQGSGQQPATPTARVGSLQGVLEWQESARQRLFELEGLAGVALGLADEHAEVSKELRQACLELGKARRAAAGKLGRAVEAGMRRLAMPRARFEVKVGLKASTDDGPEPLGSAGGDLRELSGEDVCFLLAANPGEPLLPLAKVASGGELARAMLALRLVLLGGGAGPLATRPGKSTGMPEPVGPATLVFDEVDAGIGGEAALAVGKALAELGLRYQVLAVTHLAQVAAFAGTQVAVTKAQRAGRSVARAAPVEGEARVVELSRMLSGHPDSKAARQHAEELLRTAAEASALW